MFTLKCLIIVIILCGEVFSNNEEHKGFDQSLDTESNFDDVKTGKISLSSNPVATAMLDIDKNLYPKFFDTIVSSSIDSIRKEVAPTTNIFAAENFGFNPIASQSFTHQSLRQEESDLTSKPLNFLRNARPLKYNIQTVHDPNYRVFKTEPEEQEAGTDILSALKRNPAVSAYFQPLVNAQVTHPLNYRRDESVESLESDENYKPNPYVAGPGRIRRYTRGQRRENEKKRDDDDDDAYDYSEYEALPKAFKGSRYSAYKDDKDSKEDYPYKYDSGYDHKEYDRIKDLSEKQAAEIRENPGNCNEVKRDGMTCNVCKDPKTGGNYESCSYQAEPKNNKYAYSKEKNFDSNDEPDDKSAEETDKPAKIRNYKDAQEETAPQKFSDSEEKPSSNYKQSDHSGDDNYKGYYIHTSNPKHSQASRASNEDKDDDKADSKAYDYQKSLPGFYTDNEPKKDVEHVLAEFKKKDRSACNKVQKNGMTCFQCLDKAGLKHEECMYVSESAPKQSHLAYQEVKEFTSKPATLERGNVGSESQTITTSTPPLQSSANQHRLKQKRKKAPQISLAASASNPVSHAITKQRSSKVKRSHNSEINEGVVADEPNIAPPEEFAAADSKGAFWAETVPRYSANLGVSLPEYMLSKSDHEASFDELVAGA